MRSALMRPAYELGRADGETFLEQLPQRSTLAADRA